jgi:aminopeptidase YwaD
MKTRRMNAIITALLFLFFTCSGQNSKPRSLLAGNIIDEIIGEASGERAMNHIYNLAAYNHDRLAAEYSGYFIETRYVYDKLKEYGLEGVSIDKYPGGSSWDGIRGEIWEVSPGKTKIADYGDLTAMLAQGSANADVTAELVWVGEGRQEDLDRIDVAGKIVVTAGNMTLVYSLSVPKGALGVISYESPHPLAVPLAIPFHNSNFKISGNNSTSDNKSTVKFGFFLPPREGIILRDRLLSRERITVHAVVETQNINYDLEVTSCNIKGTDPAAGEIIFSAHLFDGMVKMGANDNLSGCASILEIARMLNSMINEGRIERPKRTIRFIWAPEISGTGPWVREHPDIIKNTLCNINLDMVGLWLSKNQSILYMHRTEFGNPHYINDVMENFYDFVGLGNRYGLGLGGITKRIVAPSGSDDPFYYSIDDHTGGSDHEVFNDWGVQVPGIMMLTWPDPYYHTSGDNADKCDPTQLKRVCVIGAAAAYSVAWADEAMASKIACEVAGNSFRRLGKQVTRGMDELDKVKKEDFESIYKKAKGYIEATLINEKATLASTSELVSNSVTFNTYLARQISSVDAAGKSAIASFDSYAEGKGKSLGFTGIGFKPTELESKAKTIIPKMTRLVIDGSYLGYADIVLKLDPTIKEKYPLKGRGMDTMELGRLCNGKNTALDIKKILDTQIKQGENDLQNVINYIYILKEAGLVTI